jgi:hypothetical protein
VVKRLLRIPDNMSMDNDNRAPNRLTTTSHLFTALLLAAVGSAIFLPLSMHAAGPPAPMANRAHGQMAAGKTGPSVTPPVPRTTIPITTVPATTPPPPVPTPTTTTPAPPTPPPTAPRVLAVAAVPSGYGCDAALAYLQAHAAPGFTFECPGYAQGHQAMTCDNVAGVCPGAKVIAISTPCSAAYMNEASNSWVILGESNAALDPYGYCH